MAGETKVFKNIQQGLQELNAAGKLDDLSAKTGIDSEKLVEIAEQGVKAKQGKQFLGNLLEKLGGKIESVQTEFDILLGRKRDIGVGTTPPAVPPAMKTEVTGPLTPGAGKGFTITPSEGPVGGPLAIPGQTKPAEIPVITPEVLPAQNKSLQTVSGKLNQQPLEAEFTTVKRPSGALPEAAGARPALPAAEAAPEIPGIPKGVEPTPAAKSKALQKAAMAGTPFAAWLAYTQLKPEEQAKLPAVNATEIDSPNGLKKAVDNAANQNAIDPEKKKILDEGADTVETLAEALSREMGTTRKQFKEDQARLELFQALDTLANGLASAIGSAALLNKGSPYTVDFSKGPQVNWDAQFNRLQKDFDTQIGAITEKYKLEERLQEKEAERAFRAEESEKRRASEEEQTLLKIMATDKTTREEAAKKLKEQQDAKLSASIGVATDETASAGRLLTEKKTLINVATQRFGAAEVDKLIKQAASQVEGDRDFLRKASVGAMQFVGMDSKLNPKEQVAVTKKFAELLKGKLETAPAEAAAPAAPAAPTTAEDKERRRQELLKKAGGQ